MLSSLPGRATIYEVGPRDGLQNEAARLDTRDKLELIGALVRAGLKHIEATSFVSPRWIPQLADASQVIAGLPRRKGLVFSALVPNERGLSRAKEAGLEEVAVFLSSSETHNRKNTNRSIAEALQVYARVCAQAREAGIRVRGYVSTVWGCPYEGEVSVDQSRSVALRLLDMGCDQISLGDTIGVGTPAQTARILEAMLAEIPAPKLAMHMHDTHGTALANVWVGLTFGITTFDAAVGGLGGCPYAPGAAGNLATEDLVYMLQAMGIATGVDLGLLVRAGRFAQERVGHELPGKYLKAALGAKAKEPVDEARF
jgi:hydroxymethylglutaryl-CoA lyase